MNTDTTFVVRRIPVKAIFKLHKKNGHTDIANKLCGDFPGGSVAKSLHFKCRGNKSDSQWGNWDPHATWHGQKGKQTYGYQGGKETRDELGVWN